MKKEEVPQDDANMLEGRFKVVKYATEKDGSYTKVQTVGWEPENIVLQQAWEDIHQKVEEIKQQVLSGKLSPIAYYMEKQMMDFSMVCGYTGFWKWTIKRHLNPKRFAKLSDHDLQKYAHAFNITIEELKQIK